MLKTLLRKQIAEIFRNYYYDPKKNRARSKGATIAYIVLFAFLMIGVLGGMFTGLSIALCGALHEAGMDWMYFALMGLLAVFLGAFGSVFNTYSGLYLAKDNDLLLSMPIPVRYIMLSRLLSVYLMGALYSGVVIVPAVIVYWVIAPLSAPVVIGSIWLMLLISLVVMTLSCALGWAVAKISLKLRNKSFITVLISLVFFGVYYFFYFKAQSLIADLLANAVLYGQSIKNSAYPVYAFGRVATGDWAAMAAVGAVVAACFALTWALISRSFIRIATSSGRTSRAVYREKRAAVRSQDHALLFRELSRFAASPNYMLNCGLGTLLLPAAGVAMLIKGRALIDLFSLGAVFGMRAGALPVLLCAALCMIAAMNDMAAPSVSLEGRTLWLCRSLPVDPWKILRAKLNVQLLLTGLPMLFASICVIIVWHESALESALIVVLPQLYVFLSALFGLSIGLKRPNFAWTNEIVPIKQSMSVAFALFGGWLYAIALGGLFLLVKTPLNPALYMLAFAAATAAAGAALYLWLKRRGSRLFGAL